MEQLRKVVRKERTMELEAEAVENSMLSDMTCQRWRMVVVAASDDASKACVEYTYTWQGAEFPDAVYQATRALFDSLPARAAHRDNSQWALPVMPIPASAQKSFSLAHVYNVSFEAVAADLSWTNPIINGSEDTQWKFLQQNGAEPQIGDQRLFEAEYPGLGHVRHLERLCKVVRKERTMELEAEVVENSMLSDMTCQHWRMVVVAAADDASKACVEYTYTWQGADFPDAVYQATRDLFDSLPARAAQRDNSQWALPVMPIPASGQKSFSLAHVYNVSFEAVAADLSWTNPIINGSDHTQWKFLQQNDAEPQIGDQRLFEAEYPGLGHVRHIERLRKVVHEERSMELEVEILESSLSDLTCRRYRIVV